MSEQLLNLILDKITSVDGKIDKIENRLDALESRFDGLETKFGALETRFGALETEVKAIKADTSDIPLIRRAVLETAENVKNIERAQKSFERKTIGDITMHDHSIDILNRRQLRLESELERLKS